MLARSERGGCGFIQRYFLPLLICAYLLAAIAPQGGHWLASLSSEMRIGSWSSRLSAPTVMLGFLLFVAGLGVRSDHLRGIFRKPSALALGLTANFSVPVFVLLLIGPFLAFWPDQAEARDVIIGMAIVAAMPVAGSSAGWARAVDGDCALSLGLVLLSTLASPFCTPLALQAAGASAPDDANRELQQLLTGGTGTFLTLWVVCPTVLGVVARWVIGGTRVDAVRSRLSMASSVVLLVLCYSNASHGLPAVASNPDWDFLLLVVLAAGFMCVAGFAAGFGLAGALNADPARRASLVFGVGMANNGTGLALASTTLAAFPMAVLPVIATNLIQHLMAGAASRRL